MLLEQLTIWAPASFVNHFTLKLKNVAPMFIEGGSRDTNKDKDFLELRVDGPWFRQRGTNNCWVVECYINILIEAMAEEKDLYKNHRYVGQVCTAFQSFIPILRIGGTGANFDGTQVDCMKLEVTRNVSLQVFHYGQLDARSRVLQSTVAGTYKMEFQDATRP